MLGDSCQSVHSVLGVPRPRSLPPWKKPRVSQPAVSTAADSLVLGWPTRTLRVAYKTKCTRPGLQGWGLLDGASWGLLHFGTMCVVALQWIVWVLGRLREALRTTVS